MKQWVLGNQPLQRSTRNSELFKLKFLLKLFFKSLKIIVIINFFYILNIFFFCCKEEESDNMGGRAPLPRTHSALLAGEIFVQWTQRHEYISVGTATSIANITLSQISCPQAKVCMNGFIIKIWLLFQNRKSISYDNFLNTKPQILIKSCRFNGASTATRYDNSGNLRKQCF